MLLGLALWLALERGAERAPAAGVADAGTAVASDARAPLAAAAALEAPASPEAEAARAERQPAAQSGGTAVAAGDAPPSGALVLFHGRVLDGLDRRPIAGARAYVPPPKRAADPADPLAAPEALSDADGRFALALPSGRLLLEARLAAEGYGELVLVADAEHATPERAEEFELLPAAALEVGVSSADGALRSGVRVDLVHPGQERMSGAGIVRLQDQRWSQHTGADGVARFAALPAECELAWTVLVEEDSYGRAGRIALEPGATRRLDVVLGGRARLFGGVRDESGTPVPGLALWLARTDAANPRARESMAKALTDEHGRFAFEGVPFETFVLGLSPGEEDYVAREELVVVVDQPLVERELVVVRGLFLSGRVLGEAEEIEGLDFLNLTRLDGSWVAGKALGGKAQFELGPLLPGEYFVSAAGHSTATEVVRARAGASDVELPLLHGRELRIRIEGAPGGCELQVRDLVRGTTYFWSQTEAALVHAFVPGRHALSATAAGERVGLLAPIEIGLNGSEEELVLRLERGARCTFVHRAAQGTRSLHLLVDGTPFPLLEGEGGSELAAGAARTLLVPPRRLVAELREGQRVVARSELAPAPGERLRVELVPH